MLNRKRIAGAALLTAGAFLAREALVWAYNKTLDAAGAGIQGGLDFASASWLNAGAFLLIGVGVILLLWPNKPKEEGSRKEHDDLSALKRGAVSVIRRVRGHRSTRWYSRDRLEPVADIARSGLAVLVSFDKNGFKVPHLEVTYAEQVAIGLEAYFSILLPLLANGHPHEAILASDSASQEAEQAASAFDARGWFHSTF